jgi:hypothetical protein
MNKIKQIYEAPEAETLVVRFEGVICQSLRYGTDSGTAGDTLGLNDDDNDYGDF